MKQWPENGSTVDFDKLIDPIKDILLLAIKKGDKIYKENIKYDGYTNGNYEQATYPAPDKALSKEHLNYEKTEQNRDVYDILLTIVFQLGIEQGRRMSYKDISTAKRFIDVATTLIDASFPYKEKKKKGD